MNPIDVIKKLKEAGVKTSTIAKEAGCTVEAINKILSGERKRPNYILVDNLRNYYAKFLDAKDKWKSPRYRVGFQP